MNPRPEGFLRFGVLQLYLGQYQAPALQHDLANTVLRKDIVSLIAPWFCLFFCEALRGIEQCYGRWAWPSI